ncbi:MAG: hypothetical protein ACI8W7_002176, partial [Gammaproteobacteria bacterium]
TRNQTFFAAFSARFSFIVFSGFFFKSFFRFSMPLAISCAPDVQCCLMLNFG